jgi:hypothetical protein
MKKNKTGGVVEKFNSLDFHDDGLKSVKVLICPLPPRTGSYDT